MNGFDFSGGPTFKCPNCGFELGRSWIGPCPKCGYRASVTVTVGYPASTMGYQVTTMGYQAPNYSGTVTVTGSTISAFNQILGIKNMLTSVASTDPQRAPLIQPIIDALEKTADTTKKQEAELASKGRTDLEVYQRKIEELESLLDKEIGEEKFQSFFEENPKLLNVLTKRAMPKKSFGGEDYPDFVLHLHNNAYVLVELEKPAARLFTKKDDPASDLTHAQKQMRDYLAWVGNNPSFLRERGCEDISYNNTTGLVVIGRSKVWTKDEFKELEKLNNEVKGAYVIKTYDILIGENKAILQGFK